MIPTHTSLVKCYMHETTSGARRSFVKLYRKTTG